MKNPCPSNPKQTPHTGFAGIHRSPWLLELEVWMPSQIEAISPTVERLMQAMQRWCCCEGNEFAVELSLSEALENAVIHGNGMDPEKSVQIDCRFERGKGVWFSIKDHGKGFDPTALPNPMAPDQLRAEHGRGIYLMKQMMDDVSFAQGGTEVRMRKKLRRKGNTTPAIEARHETTATLQHQA